MHNEPRGTVFQEAVIGLFTGALYGGTHTLTGHPLDTIKSKMQIQVGFSNHTAFQVASKILKSEGYIG
jgi:solute carrier family 25 carnitine/acylcarnitine transporter 20/29